ncbi:MAG: phosphohydrolase [Burkholderiaceae bacterium]|nr:phosphohydrolase [Burkholderiaceae bacterium]
MAVVPISASAIRLNQPVPFALRDASGLMLVPRGGMVTSEAARKLLADRGVFIDMNDAEAFKKALAGKVDSMVRNNDRLGRIARAESEVDEEDLKNSSEPAPGSRRSDPTLHWDGLVTRAAGLLRDPQAEEFLARIDRLDEDLLDLLGDSADRALLTLIYGAITDSQKYSVTHSLLVTVLVELASRHLLAWPKEWRAPLRRAALTMNIAMTNLQDQLAMQDTPTSIQQRELIKTHALRGVQKLGELGISDSLWMLAVEQHHSSPPGPLAAMEPATQLARLIKRADVFAARLSPRKTRKAMSATAAAKAAYLDENQHPDEAGAAIIKATGLYPPGSFVRLVNKEVAIVLRRGLRANNPVVASVVGSNGMAIAKPIVRDTRLKQHEIAGSAAPHEVNVRLHIEALIELSS